MLRKKTVQVFIPVNNGEKTIARLLKSVLKQRGGLFSINRIVVQCDGCTDGTAAAAIAASKKRVTVINDGRHLGITARLNNHYKRVTADILVTLDAGIVLAHDYALEALVREFADERAALSVGRMVNTPQKTFVGRALNAYEDYWSRVVGNVRNGNNVYACSGQIVAARRDFIRQVTIPSESVSAGHYLYFSALKKRLVVRRAYDAYSFYGVPPTYKLFLTGHNTPVSSVADMREHFGLLTAAHEYRIPLSAQINAYVKTMIEEPLYMLAALALYVARPVSNYQAPALPVTLQWQLVNPSK